MMMTEIKAFNAVFQTVGIDALERITVRLKNSRLTLKRGRGELSASD